MSVRSSGFAQGVIAACLVGMAMSMQAAEWPGGSSFTIPAGMSVTNAAVQPSISCFTNNGTLTFLPGAEVTLTGSVITAIGSGVDAAGVFECLGGRLLNQGLGFFVVGHAGASGSMTIAAGAEVRMPSGRFCVARNEEGLRERPAQGDVSVAGLLSADTIELTGFFPTNLAPPYVLSATLAIDDGGVVEAGLIAKNDCACSEIHFNGGTLRAQRDTAALFSGRGTLDLVIADNTNAVFDTNGKNVVITPGMSPGSVCLRGQTNAAAIGNGGLVKTGEGSLMFQLPPSHNTFTGAVTVLAGVLDLGRPLAEHQTVTVSEGANFVVRDAADLAKITYLGQGDERMTYTVAVDTDSLDLTAVNDRYHDDRLAGPISGTATLSNTVTHAAGDADNPFRLLGQGSTLNLTNTGLESVFLQVEGSGTFNFLGHRDFTSADAGRLTITDGGYRQDGVFTLADPNIGTPAVLALSSGRFAAATSLDVGVTGFAHFAADGAAISAGRVKVGGGTGYAGTFSQSGGTVTLNTESYVGADGSTGTLLVTGGQFIVNSNLRIASNPSVNTGLRPQASVTVSNALLRCNEFRFNSWWPLDGSVRTVESGVLTLQEGGVLETASVYKNDDPIARVFFEGGLVRARQNHSKFFNAEQPYGTLDVVARSGHSINLDTQGFDVTIPDPPGTIIFSGSGGLRKMGTGRLTLAADQLSYAGDTEVVAGVLRLGEHHRLPHGPDAGHIRLAADAVLDLNGKDDIVNRLIGRGRVLSTNGPATLGVLADGSDDTWDRAWCSGAVSIEKYGTGTLTLTAPQAVPTNLTVAAGTVVLAPAQGFPFYRFKVEGVKDPGVANSMQLSEIALFNEGVDVTPNRIGIAYDPTGGTGGNPEINAFPAGETPEKAVDGIVPPDTTVKSKWLDFRSKASRSAEDKERVWLRIDFASPQPITHYNWATGNDAADRDPAAWRLQGSHDGETWVDLDVQSGFNATSTRNAWVSPDGFSVTSVHTNDIVSDTGVVTVKEGASLLLNGVAETVGALAGRGTVTVNGANLTIATPAECAAFFAGDIGGTGGLIKTGAGTQALIGTNAYTGATIVQQGTLQIQSLVPFRWFRFTLMKNRSNLDVTQLSELALYDASGQRQNVGLVAGASVAELLPGQFATPQEYSVGSPGEVVFNLFDQSTATKWCLNENVPAVNDPATHRIVVMRLPENAPEIVSYNLCTANDDPGRDPVTWTLEGSMDGSSWILVDNRANVMPPSTGGTGTGDYVDRGRFLYYNDGVPYGLTDRAVGGGAGGDTDAIPAGSPLEIREGATLEVMSDESIDTLRVDMLSAGTLTKLIAEPNGTLYIVNAGGQTTGLVLPLTIGSLEGRANLGSWTVYIDGVRQDGVTLSINADGRLTLHAKGMLMTIR